MSYKTKCLLILRWAKSKPRFNTDFVEDMLELLEDGRDLTSSQEGAIDNIMERWNI